MPPLIEMLPVTDGRKPYPLDWDEQRRLIQKLPKHLARMVLYKVNTGDKGAGSLPVDDQWLRGVHNLKHTFGRRLRAAGVPLETRRVLLGHKTRDTTSHYSAPEIQELIDAANRVCAQGDVHKTPTLTLLKRKMVNVGGR